VTNDGVIRFYTGNTLTITSSTDNITKIVFTYGSNYSNLDLSLTDDQPGTYDSESNTWTGSSSSIQFINNNSKQTRFYRIVVTIGESGGEDPEPSTSTGDYYQKVTSASDLTSGEYLIVCESYNRAFKGSNEGSTLSSNYVNLNVTINNSIIEANDDVNASTFTIDLTAGTLKSKSGYYIGKTSDSNGMNISAEEQYTNTFSIDNNGNAIIAGTAGPTLRYNGGSNDIFRYYKTTTTNVSKIQLYKKVSNNTTAQQVATPTFAPEAGTYSEAQNVTITCATEGAAIHYTTDGTEPTAESSAYGEAIAVNQNMTIKAIAVKENWTSSEIAEAAYVIKKNPTLTFNPTSVTVYIGNDFTAPTLTTVPANLPVTYSSSDENLAVVDESTGEILIADNQTGTATITATFAGNDEYNSATATYTITIVAKKNPTMSFDKEGITVYPNAENVTLPVLTTNPEGLTVTYTSSDDDIATFIDGEILIGDKLGTATITATFAGNDEYNSATAIYTITVEAKPYLMAEPNTLDIETTVGVNVDKQFTVMGENLKGDVTLTLNDENNVFTINPTTITKDDAENGVTVNVTYAPSAEDYNEATITIASTDAESVTVSLAAIATVPEVVAAPTFSHVAGSYGEAVNLTISCATEGATISYSTDGGNTWNDGTSLALNDDATVMAKATKNGYTASEIVSAEYIIDIPAEPIIMEPIDGYFSVKNNGNEMFANIQGRKTLTFTDDIKAKAGTVIRLVTNENGQVQVLRSQAADLQGYADRAMRYVPEIVQLVADKLNAEGVGNILGEHGLDEIMEKFNESFDHHLYVEPVGDNYRIYGSTPSMQPVVDFYREHQNQVEAKLPQLEQFINDAIDKVLQKTNGSGSSVLVDFNLHTIWENMGGTLPEPIEGDLEAIMNFYRSVLNNKNNVWKFAYETAMIYWLNLKDHPRFVELKAELGDFAQYIDKIEYIRPETKYYIVQKDNKPDFISEDNVDLINTADRTLWTLEDRTEFSVNFPANYTLNSGTEYATTLYTDFAYDLPEGVTAYKVTEVTDKGFAKLTALTGTVPAQTPVLLKTTTAGEKILALSTATDKAPTDNLLVGPDYFIKEYQIKTPQVETLFSLAYDIFGETFYNSYIKEYEHLMLKTAGTVNNKYFWGLSSDDLKKCTYTNDMGEGDCVVRTLSLDNNGKHLGFYGIWQAGTNQAFLASEQFNPVTLELRGDVNRDGYVTVADVTALIDILLELPATTYMPQYDYVAADFNEDGEITIKDVTALIDYLLNVQ